MTDPNPDSGAETLALIPLESSPDILTNLLHKLGVSEALQVYDVDSLQEPRSVFPWLPHPVLALLLVFPLGADYNDDVSKADSNIPAYAGKGADEPVVWWPQTITNACGMMALLHAACNGSARQFIKKDSTLNKLLETSVPLEPGARAKLLRQTPELAEAHQGAATQGDTAAPDAHANVDLHYTCFVAGTDGALYELDGRRPRGPIRLGQLGADKDILSEEALALGPRKYLKYAANDPRFSMVALAGAD